MNRNDSISLFMTLSTLLILATASGQEPSPYERAGRENVDSSNSARPKSFDRAGRSQQTSSAPSVNAVHETRIEKNSMPVEVKKQDSSKSSQASHSNNTLATPSTNKETNQKKLQIEELRSSTSKKEEPKPSPSASPK